jgi:hypothetical protein
MLLAVAGVISFSLTFERERGATVRDLIDRQTYMLKKLRVPAFRVRHRLDKPAWAGMPTTPACFAYPTRSAPIRNLGTARIGSSRRDVVALATRCRITVCFMARSSRFAR